MPQKRREYIHKFQNGDASFLVHFSDLPATIDVLAHRLSFLDLMIFPGKQKQRMGSMFFIPDVEEIYILI